MPTFHTTSNRSVSPFHPRYWCLPLTRGEHIMPITDDDYDEDDPVLVLMDMARYCYSQKREFDQRAVHIGEGDLADHYRAMASIYDDTASQCSAIAKFLDGEADAPLSVILGRSTRDEDGAGAAPWRE